MRLRRFYSTPAIQVGPFRSQLDTVSQAARHLLQSGFALYPPRDQPALWNGSLPVNSSVEPQLM